MEKLRFIGILAYPKMIKIMVSLKKSISFFWLIGTGLLIFIFQSFLGRAFGKGDKNDKKKKRSNRKVVDLDSSGINYQFSISHFSLLLFRVPVPIYAVK